MKTQIKCNVKNINLMMFETERGNIFMRIDEVSCNDVISGDVYYRMDAENEYQPLTKSVLGTILNGQLVHVIHSNKDVLEISSINFYEENEEFIMPRSCFARFISHKIILSNSSRILDLNEAEYQEFADIVRLNDSKERFLDAIEGYCEHNTEFINIKEFLVSHIEQATTIFFQKTKSFIGDYDVMAALNIFRGAYWCDVFMKDGTHNEAVLMDSQISELQNGNLIKFKNTHGEEIQSSDICGIEKDEMYTL